MKRPLTCRGCGEPVELEFLELGLSPLSSAYRSIDEPPVREPFIPISVYWCGSCFLVQLPYLTSPEEVFTGFTFLSSLSTTVVDRARDYARASTRRFQLDGSKQVVEVASNDGYLLRHFHDMGIPVLGIDPAADAVEVARSLGIETEQAFFGAEVARALADRGVAADLLVANNVLQHVPDLHDFVAGIGQLLAPGGVVSFEVASLLSLMEGLHYDSIYHESYSYFSLTSLAALLLAHDLEVFEVEQLAAHGGSLRVLAGRAGSGPAAPRRRESVTDQLRRESDFGLDTESCYADFAARVLESKLALLDFVVAARRGGRSVVAYGAPAKANTLLHYCGLSEGMLDFAVDLNPMKQGRYLPGTRIEIRAPEAIAESRPDYVLLLAWNLADEIMEQLAYIGTWGGQFVLPFPRVHTREASG